MVAREFGTSYGSYSLSSYQTILLSHHKSPVHWEIPSQYCAKAEGKNPLCGDHVAFYMQESGAIWFMGESCLYGKAMASLICSTLQGKNKDESKRACEQFALWLKGTSQDENVFPPEWRCFTEIRDFPVRQKCVLTPVDVFKDCLDLFCKKKDSFHASI